MIERQTIEGREASVLYLTGDFEPTDKDSAEVARITYDDGDTALLFFDEPAKTEDADFDFPIPLDPDLEALARGKPYNIVQDIYRVQAERELSRSRRPLFSDAFEEGKHPRKGKGEGGGEFTSGGSGGGSGSAPSEPLFHTEPLSKRHMKAIFAYQGGGSDVMNAFAAGRDIADEYVPSALNGDPRKVKPAVADLKAAISQSCFKNNATVYRGVASGDAYEVGKTLPWNSFLSTSRSEAEAKDRGDISWMRKHETEEETPESWLIEMYTPAGTHALDVQAATKSEMFKHESEVLFSPGIGVQVLSVDPKNRRIVARLIESENKTKDRVRDRVMRVFKLRDTKVYLHVHDAYDPNEPRESSSGRWTKGGGGASSKTESKPEAKAKPEDKHSSAAALLQHEYPKEISPERFLSKQPPEVLDKIRRVERDIHNSVPTDALVSEGGHKQPDGSWTPERRKVHDEIMRKILSPEAIRAATPKSGEKPTFTMLGGRGGSGKSWFTRNQVCCGGSLVLDNDKIKSMLPEYEGWNAALLHEEASYLFDRIDLAARKFGLNIAHDATLKTYATAAKRVQEYKDLGYKVHGLYMFVPPHISAQRAIKRFMGPEGRYVPPSYILGSTSNESSFDQLRPNLDKWGLYRNDVEGKEPQLVAAMGEKPKTGDAWRETKFDDGRSLWLK